MHTVEPEHRIAREIGEAVRRRRRELGLDQEQLALVANVSRRTLHALEAGKPTVRLDILNRVLDALGLELAVLERGATRPKGAP